MKNTSEDLDDSVRVTIVNNFAQKLVNSGYELHQVRKLLVGGLKGYQRKLMKSKEVGGKRMHVGAMASSKARYKKKLLNKANWFRQKPNVDGIKVGKVLDEEECDKYEDPRIATEVGGKKNDREYRTTSVLFIDQTRGGELARRLRAVEPRLQQMTGYRIKIVEKGGSKLKHLLPNTNPWKGSRCEREDCTTCAQDDEEAQDCFRTNILYESWCVTCYGSDPKRVKKVGGNDAIVYVGESSRSLYERTKEHWEDAGGGSEDSHIHKHWINVHSGVGAPKFKFRVIRSFQDCLSRQIAESVRIDMRGTVLNSQAVYSRCRLPRLTVDKEWEQSLSVDPTVMGGVEMDKELRGIQVDSVIEKPVWKRKVGNESNEDQSTVRPRKRRKVNNPLASENWGEEDVCDIVDTKRKSDFLSGEKYEDMGANVDVSRMKQSKIILMEWPVMVQCDRERMIFLIL